MTVRRKVLLAAVAALALCVPQARAAVDVAFGAAVNVNDNTSLFFGVSSRYFNREPRVVETWSQRVPDPDDLSVLMFLAARSGRSVDAVFAMRRTGLSWWDVSIRLGVPADVWFVPVERPGPPYGKAYGYWRKHGRDTRAYRIDDRSCRDLVAVRMMHDYYGIPAERAMDLRRDGRRIDSLVGDEYRTRHGNGKGGKDRAQEGSTHDHGGKAGGKGNGKGHGKGHK
jgi:hypothetical protein